MLLRETTINGTAVPPTSLVYLGVWLYTLRGVVTEPQTGGVVIVLLAPPTFLKLIISYKLINYKLIN